MISVYTEVLVLTSSQGAGWLGGIDVTNHVKEAIREGLSNVDLLIKWVSGDTLARPRFYSKNHSNYKPVLAIDGVDIIASKDAILQASSPTTKTGTWTNLRVSSAGSVEGEQNIIISFPIGGITEASSAILKMYQYQVDFASCSIGIFKLTRPDWVETEATWNNYKAGSPWTTPGGDYVAEVDEPEPPVIIDTVPAYSPQSIVNLVFQAGDSAEYPMGKFYVDRMQYSVNTESMRIDARNSIGKYLKDQTFDERNSYEVTKVSDMLEAILSGAGLSDYYVQPNNTLLGMEFAPNKDMLGGIEEVVQYIENWQIREEVSGRVVIADKTSSEFTQPSRYTFRRDRDIFSRDVSSDDRSVYARVCAHTADFSVKVYRPVNTNLGWNAPANKTLYQTVPDGTTSYEAAGIAVKLAESMANSGAIETFVCAFRPQIMPGDEAEILEEDESATMLGIITQVKHSFGTGGFFTEIVVDSGGRIGKPRLKEIIGTLAPPPASKRL